MGCAYFLWVLIAITLFPCWRVVDLAARQLRHRGAHPQPDQFEHWKLALGIPHIAADGTVIEPPFPVMRWLWNSIKIACLISSILIVAISTTAAYAFARD